MTKVRFPTSWSNLEYGFNTLKLLLILFGIGGILQGAKEIIALNKTPFVLEVKNGRPEAAAVGRLSYTPDWIQGFTKDYIMVYGNWDYNNYNERMERLRNYTDVLYMAVIEEQVKKSEEDIIGNKLVNKFEIHTQNIVSSGKDYIIEVDGINTMEGMGIEGEPAGIKYRLTVRKTKCTAFNPWALKIMQLEEIPL